MKKTSLLLVGAISVGVTTLSGCIATNASKTGGSDYRTAETRKAGEVQYGVIAGVRTVTIRENEGTAGHNAHTMGSGGAVLGGVMGGNSNGLNGALLGGLIGAVAGSLASDKLGEVEGWEVDVQLPDGKIIVVVQAKKEGETFASGMKVRVVKYGDTYRISGA